MPRIVHQALSLLIRDLPDLIVLSIVLLMQFVGARWLLRRATTRLGPLDHRSDHGRVFRGRHASCRDAILPCGPVFSGLVA